MPTDLSQFTPVDETDLQNFAPDNSSDGSPSPQDGFRPVSPDELDQFHSDTSAAGLRQRLAFNLENDYQPDQGNYWDQAILGAGEGLASIPGTLGGLSRYVGLSGLGSRLSRYSQNAVNEYEDLANTLGSSPGALTAREVGQSLAGTAPIIAAGALGSAAAGPVGAAAAFAGVGGLETLGNVENQAASAYEAKGLNPDDATARARIPSTIAGVASAAINYFVPGGAKALLDKFTAGIVTKTAVQTILKEAVNNALSVGALSASDTAAQGLIAKASYDPERTLKDIAIQSTEAAGSGAGLGMLMSVPHLAVEGGKVALGKSGQAWESLMNEPGWVPPDVTPPRPGVGAQPENAPTIGPRPAAPTDEPRVKLASKILKAAGYDPEFAAPFADTFARLFDPTDSWDGEAYRQTMLRWLDANGVRPVESVSRKGTFREEQAAHNAEALTNLMEQARTTPLHTPPITEVPIEPTAATEVPPQQQPVQRPLVTQERAPAPTEFRPVAPSDLANFAPEQPTAPALPISVSGGEINGQKEIQAQIQNQTNVQEGLLNQPPQLPQRVPPAGSPEVAVGPASVVSPEAPQSKRFSTPQYERPPDIVDWVDGAHGKLRRLKPGEKSDYSDIWRAAQRAYPSMFTATGSAPDVAAEGYRRDTGKDISDEEFLSEIAATPGRRIEQKKRFHQTTREGKQDADFRQIAVENLRRDPAKTRPIVSDSLSRGDKFSVQGNRFVVSDVRTRPGDETMLQSITVQDGPKFGVQKLGSDATINIDKGSPRRGGTGQRQVATGPLKTGSLPPETPPPTGKEAFSLGGAPSSTVNEQGTIQIPTIAAGATGISDIKNLIGSSQLSAVAKAGTLKALEILEASGLDTSKLRLELHHMLSGNAHGRVVPTEDGEALIHLIQSPDPEVGPHEVFHLLINALPEADRAALEAERIASIPANAPAEIRAGQMSSQQFVDSGLPHDLYPFINLDEFAAQQFGKRLAEETASGQPGLWQRIKDWFAKIWESLKSLVRDPAASDQIYQDIVSGKQKYDTEKAIGISEERAKFVTKQSEAEKAIAFANGPEAKKIEGKEFLAQVDAPVKLMEKHGVQDLPARSRRALGYTESKGIQQIGEVNNGAPEDYFSIRNNSEPWLQQRLGVMANQHAVAFEATMKRAMEDGTLAKTELNSPEIKEKIAKMQGAFVSALLEEQALRSARVGIQTALNEALELLKKEHTSDLRQAELEAQIRILKDVGESRVALERLLDDITTVLLSTPQGDWILRNGGTPQEMIRIYKDIKRSTGQTTTNDQLIGVAGYLLSRMADLRDQLLAAQFAQQDGPLSTARAKLKTLLDSLRTNPGATLERMMRARENRAKNMAAAEFIYFQLQKELTRDLEPIYDRIKAGEVAGNILNDPELKAYSKAVQVQAGAYGTVKPYEPFIRDIDAPGGFVIEPDGHRLVGLGSHLMTANDSIIRKSYKKATESIKRFNEWIDTANPNDPLYITHILNRDTIRDYWGDVAMLTPNHRDDPFRWTLSILDKTVSLAGGRLMPQVRRAANGLNRMGHFAKAWNMKASAQFEPQWRAAMKSHGLQWNNLTDNDLARNSVRYNAHFQELANSNQFRHGNLAAGDKSMAGWPVTKEDMTLLATQTRLDADAYEIVQKNDRQITEDTRGLPEGTVVYRRAAPVTKYTLPRIPDFDRIPVLEPVAHAYDAYAANSGPEALTAFTTAMDAIWPTDGTAFLRQRNADFSKPTIFDGPGGAFEALSKEIQDGRAYDSFDTTAQRISELSGRPLEEVRPILANEFGRITSGFVRKLAAASESGRSIVVKGGDPANSFTEERGDQLGPWTFYRTGWSSSDDVRATAGHMVAVAQHRLLNGMKAQLADLLRMKKEFEQRQKELDRQGVSNPGSKAVQESRVARRRGATFDSWLDLDYRISGLENRIKEIEDHTIPRTNEASKVVGRYLGAVTKILISSFTTTIRNIGIVYPFRTMYALGNGSLTSALAGLGIGTIQASKMVASLGFSMMKLPVYTLIKGIGQGVANTIQGKGKKELWQAAVRAIVVEFSNTAQTRLRDVREMIDAGVHIPAEGENEYNNQVADAIYREIPRQGHQLSKGAKIALAPLALAESTFFAAVTSGNPSIGDAAVNSIWWKFLKSYFGPASVFKRKANALLKRLDRNYYRTFDLENPTAPENAFEPADLNLNSDELSRWRRSFNESGLNFDAKVVEFMKRLKVDPKAEFLTPEETVRLANWGISQFNRTSATNAASVFRSTNPLISWVRPLLGWQVRALASFMDFLSVPAHVPNPKSSERMLTAQKMGQWLGKAVGPFLVGTMIVGAISELELEGVTRGYRAVFYNQTSPNRWPWEHESADKTVMSMARYPAQSIPLIAQPLAAALPGNTSRQTFNPSLVMLEKSKDIAAWVSYGMQTGNWWYKTPSTAAGFYQDIKAITSRTQPGLTLRKNAQALVQRFGPEDNLRKPDFSVPANLSPLSPYGQKLWDAAYRGDKREVMVVARDAMATAKRIGKPDPRKSVEDLFRSGNFIGAALAKLPSQTEYRKMFQRMSDSDRKTVKEAEVAYARAAGWLGFNAPHFYQTDEKATQSVRRAQPPIGTQRSLSRY